MARRSMRSQRRFENNAYSMKRVFAEVGAYCMGELTDGRFPS